HLPLLPPIVQDSLSSHTLLTLHYLDSKDSRAGVTIPWQEGAFVIGFRSAPPPSLVFPPFHRPALGCRSSKPY
ncbi:hypothetical protein JMJ77_0005708, partial [Colletotrichum scovillei]